jgi:hypothetical protein
MEKALQVSSPLSPAIIPEPATAGRPIPGNAQSPTESSLLISVLHVGNSPSLMEALGPYVPLCRRKKRSCVLGVPISSTSQPDRAPGRASSTARHRISFRSSLSFSYSRLLKPLQSDDGSVAGVYACTVCLPSGACTHGLSSKLGTLTRTRSRGLSRLFQELR